MAESSGSDSKFNISFGNVAKSQVVIGDYNKVAQSIGLSPHELGNLKAVFEGLRTNVAEQAPEERRSEALKQAAELEGALVSEEPDPGRVRKVLRWFRDHAPQVAGAVVSVVVHPLVGRIVEGAGEAIADQFRELIDEEL
jgi:hypothetical protein